jgi:hypothetical protein
MVAYNKFNQFVQDIAQKQHALQSDALTYALSSTLPAATNTVLANITQITYTANGGMSGRVPTIASCVQTSGILKLIVNNLTITQGSPGPSNAFQYVVFYNATPAAGPLISWWDYGSAVTLANADTFSIQPDPTNGILQIQ